MACPHPFSAHWPCNKGPRTARPFSANQTPPISGQALEHLDASFHFSSFPVLNEPQSELDCRFTFDFTQVYWNSRLSAEHERLVNLFKPEDVVADVFAGVGPFALPAGKKGCGVFANDLNPNSYKYLQVNIKDNKVRAFCD